MSDKTTFRDWLKVLVLLLDEAVAAVLLFVMLHFWGVRILLSDVIILAVPVAVLVFIIHIKVIPSFHLKQATGREGMIGLKGKVARSLTPVGTVYVKGENWKAKSAGGNVEIGESVEIAGIEGLTLKVVRLQEG